MLHVSLGDRSTILHRFRSLFQPIRGDGTCQDSISSEQNLSQGTIDVTVLNRRMARPHDRGQSRCGRLRRPHRSTIYWLDRWDGRVGFSHLRIRRTGQLPLYTSTLGHTVAQAITPPLMIISGFAPKFSGFQTTRSARHPVATCPMRWDIPWQMALTRIKVSGAHPTHSCRKLTD